MDPRPEQPGGEAAAIDTFTSLGFVEAGYWELQPYKPGRVRCVLTALQDERVVYAFLVADEVAYIGICDSSGVVLRGRISRYEQGTGGGTNLRIRDEIAKCLSEGKAVRLFALWPTQVMTFGLLTVDLVKGLENPLINYFRPAWNIRR